MSNELRLTDGQLSFSGGVQSYTVRTKATQNLPDGIKPNQVAWLINGQVRGGGIGQRAVLQPLVEGATWKGLYQGGLLYQPDSADPHLLLAIGGRLWRVRVDTDNSVTDLSALSGLTMPSDQVQAYFGQAEMFAVWQAGDLTTKPIFYDFGSGLRPQSIRRSNGFLGVANPANEIIPSGPMDFYAQRLWYAFGRQWCAGDIALNQASGTIQFGFRDSVIKVTENPVANAGDGFSVPTVAGSIRGLAHASNLDTALGESQLFVFTRRAVYACSAPITRDDWTAATLSLMPLQKVVLNKGGAFGDRCIVPVNGDLFFVSPPNGDIRSVQASLRYFGQWGNVPLSNNESRVLNFNDRSLLRFASGIQFDNRLLETALPVQTPVGVAHQAIVPLDFDIISTFEERRPPAWEGVYDLSGGPLVLQMFEGDFGGRERAFAVVWSPIRQAIEVWELRPDLRFENGENRVTRVIEFPAYPFGDAFGLKELESGELWFDKILGTVDVEVYYRPDSHACWIKWDAFQKCAAKDCREDPDNPCPQTGYPVEPWCEQDAIPVTLPKPPFAQRIPGSNRPSNWGYQFQVRLVIKGWCQLRGILLYALWRERRPFEGLRSTPGLTRL